MSLEPVEHVRRKWIELEGRLPVNIEPEEYYLALSELEYGGTWRYNGLLQVDAVVSVAASEIVMNAKDLIIRDATLTQVGIVGVHIPATKIFLIEEEEIVRLSFPVTFPPGHLAFTIRFNGTMNDNMAGFYRAKYTVASPELESAINDSKDSYVLVTHFEPSNARQAFPCFDEPNLKARFQLEIELPECQEALSNTSVLSICDGKQPGMKRVVFEKTPVMSTYLAAWAVGEFEFIERLTDHEHNGRRIPVRIYTTKGLSQHGRFALKYACDVLDYFATIFGVDYPLSKCDHLVVPEFISGAMENWGLIVYRTTKILFDEQNSDNRLRLKAAYVVAHELAHQWFGNLVTMNWWNEIWLNEGFATWAGYLAVDHFFPEWKVWTHFTANVMEDALSLDSLPTSHPLEIQVKETWEVDQIFDEISYFKGASLVRMMSDYLGPQVFLEGISSYLRDKSYSNATSAALFDDLSKVSGTDVASFMEPWIREAGFPVVEVSEDNEIITVNQHPFIGHNQSKTGEDVTRWCIPIALRDIVGEAEKELLTTNQLVKAKSPCGEKCMVSVNHKQSLYCYIKYAPDFANKFDGTVSEISTEDKVTLLRDLRALTTAGDYLVGDLLTCLIRLNDHDDLFVVNEKLKCLDGLESIFSAHPLIAKGLETYKRGLLSGRKMEVNWVNKYNDDYLTIEKNRLQLQLLLALNHKETISEVEKRFASWMSGARDAVPQSLQSVILGRGVALGGEAAYKAVKKEYIASRSIDGKEICLAAMGRAKEPALVADLLDFAISEHMPLQNVHLIALALGGNDDSKHVFWNFVKTNWEHVYKRLSRNPIVLNWWIEMGLRNFSDLETEKDISSFFKGKDVRVFQRSLLVAIESIRRSAEFKSRSEQEVMEWLLKHDFATDERSRYARQFNCSIGGASNAKE